MMYAIILLSLIITHPTTSVRVQCNHPEKIRQDHIHYCCKHPDGHNDITEACAKRTNFKLPSDKEEAIEDVTVEHVMQGRCWAECVFRQFGFLRGSEFDMQAVREYYESTYANDTEYMKEMIAAYDHCHGKGESATKHFVEEMDKFSSKKNCNPTSSISLSCVIYYFFHNCPTQRWAHTAECTQTLNFSQKCKDALTTM